MIKPRRLIAITILTIRNRMDMKRSITFGFGCLFALGLVFGVIETAQAQANPCQPVDHFQCYEVKEVEKLDPGPGPVTLDDQFGGVIAQVKKAKLICAPVSKNGGGIMVGVHLVCYELKKGLKPEQEVTIQNQFGNQVLRVDKARLLCVPSTKQINP